MAKIPDVGKPGGNRKDRIHGGETYTVVYTTSGHDLGLKKGDRIRFEHGQSPNSDTLFPDTNTVLNESFPEIELQDITNPPGGARTYEFVGLLNGEKAMLYLQEGYTAQPSWPLITPEPEMEIWVIKPGPGGGGGVAGLRR